MRSPLAALLLGALLAAAPIHARQGRAQRTFETLPAASHALADALLFENPDRIVEILGPSSRHWLLSGDAAADRAEWRAWLAAYDRHREIVRSDDGRATLLIGQPPVAFPAPLVQRHNRWRFDAEAGRAAFLERRAQRRSGAKPP